jgi:glycerol uptake facilitator-like aquaporin
MSEQLARRLSAEAVGTAFLAAAVVGSGIAAQRLSPGNTGLQLLENSTATGAVLVALILALGPVSGAHFNPLVTIAERVFGRIATATTIAYVAVQTVGAVIGVAVANVMFGDSAFTVSAHMRSGHGLLLSEAVAAFGLLVVIFGVARSEHHAAVAYAVGAYIAAAYWFTSSTSFANPALTVARSLTDTFAGIDPSSVAPFVLMQLVGGLAAVAILHLWYPKPSATEPAFDAEAQTR